MAQSTNNLSIVLNQQDSNGVNVLNRLIGAISYAGLTGEFVSGSLPDTSAHSQTLPNAITVALQFYFKNTSTAVDSDITVTWTPQGGSTMAVQVVGPGGIIAFWQTATDTDYGITALSLQAETAGATYEYFIGG